MIVLTFEVNVFTNKFLMTANKVIVNCIDLTVTLIVVIVMHEMAQMYVTR